MNELNRMNTHTGGGAPGVCPQLSWRVTRLTHSNLNENVPPYVQSPYTYWFHDNLRNGAIHVMIIKTSTKNRVEYNRRPKPRSSVCSRAEAFVIEFFQCGCEKSFLYTDNDTICSSVILWNMLLTIIRCVQIYPLMIWMRVNYLNYKKHVIWA